MTVAQAIGSVMVMLSPYGAEECLHVCSWFGSFSYCFVGTNSLVDVIFLTSTEIRFCSMFQLTPLQVWSFLWETINKINPELCGLVYDRANCMLFYWTVKNHQLKIKLFTTYCSRLCAHQWGKKEEFAITNCGRIVVENCIQHSGCARLLCIRASCPGTELSDSVKSIVTTSTSSSLSLVQYLSILCVCVGVCKFSPTTDQTWSTQIRPYQEWARTIPKQNQDWIKN